MADSADPDTGCLSALSCCLGKRSKKSSVAVELTNNFATVDLTNIPTIAKGEDDSTADEDDDLWRVAYSQLDEKTRNWINLDTSPEESGTIKHHANGLIRSIRDIEQEKQDKALKLTIGNREILWRDYVDRVASIATAIGDIAVPFAPAPTPAVWSAVKVLLATHVSECEDFAAIMGCTDIVLVLMRRGVVYEEIYLGKSPWTGTQKDLRQTLVSVYKDCLEFLAFLGEEMKKQRASRFLEALMDPRQGEQRVSAVKALEETLRSAVEPCEAVASQEHRQKLQELERPLKRVDENVQAVLKSLERHEIEQAMNYISTIPVGSHHAEKHDARTPKTGEWLVSHPKFLEWEDSACSSVLWLQGYVGTGKSFLTSMVIDHYRNATSLRNDEGFAFFYCSSSDPGRRNIYSILRSYIRQLSEISGRPETVHEASYSLYQQKAQIQNEITLEACELALEKMINSYPRTTMILDALDECEKDTRRELGRVFKRLVDKSNRPLKIFVASRMESDIKPHLASATGSQALVEVDTMDNHGDIEKYVKTEMEKWRPYWGTITPRNMDLVERTLIEQGNGMFRWTHLQWEQLKTIDTNGGLEQRLGSLPKTLEEAYDELYARSDPEGPERLMLQRAVRWVMCAREPLSSRTLLSAMRMQSEKEDATNVFQEADLTEASLETVCRHLVVHDQRFDVWKFPHASVSEYFKERGGEWITDREVRIAGLLVEFMTDCCSNYGKIWSLPGADSDEDEDEDEDDDGTSSSSDESWWWDKPVDPDNSLDPRHRLQRYTSRHWGEHIQDLSDDSSKATNVVEPLKTFIGESYAWKQPSSAYQIFCKHILPEEFAFESWRVESRAKEHPAFLVAYVGLDKLLQGWWDRDLEPSWFKTDEGSDLLAVAAAFGRIDFCADLIRRGCDVNRCTNQNALEAAITNRRIDITELLLDTGAHPNVIVDGRSVLCVAAAKGGQYVQLLMKKGADPDIRCTDCAYGSALSAAAYFNEIGSLSVLIKMGANVNSQDPESHFGSPLAAAACGGSLECVRLLIEHGADSNAFLQYGKFGSPLAAAAFHGSLECARLLIEHGADATAFLQYGEYGSPLAAAVDGGELECIRLLIEHGADANILLQHGEYGSPLAAAAYNGSLECVRLLIEHGADSNAFLQYGEYGSPLAAAVAGGELKCAHLLIEHGADTHAFLEFGEYGSVLAAAVLGWYAKLEVVRYLVEKRGAGPTHLAIVRPTGKEIMKFDDEDYREILAYLIKDCRFDPQLLHGIGVDPQYMPPGAMDLPRNINGT